MLLYVVCVTLPLLSICQNELMVTCHKLYSMCGVGQCAFSVTAPSVWNSLADYMHDPALELNSLLHLRNDLFYVGWGVKLYSLTHLTVQTSLKDIIVCILLGTMY